MRRDFDDVSLRSVANNKKLVCCVANDLTSLRLGNCCEENKQASFVPRRCPLFYLSVPRCRCRSPETSKPKLSPAAALLSACLSLDVDVDVDLDFPNGRTIEGGGVPGSGYVGPQAALQGGRERAAEIPHGGGGHVHVRDSSAYSSDLFGSSKHYRARSWAHTRTSCGPICDPLVRFFSRILNFFFFFLQTRF